MAIKKTRLEQLQSDLKFMKVYKEKVKSEHKRKMDYASKLSKNKKETLTHNLKIELRRNLEGVNKEIEKTLNEIKKERAKKK